MAGLSGKLKSCGNLRGKYYTEVDELIECGIVFPNTHKKCTPRVF